jgi:hypothetical protein
LPILGTALAGAAALLITVDKDLLVLANFKESPSSSLVPSGAGRLDDVMFKNRGVGQPVPFRTELSYLS